ncbi:MAG: C39 family peptidase [Proteobacteria bacterium]|nr:C39 family peptidase [Pseudomonadota bacterium]
MIRRLVALAVAGVVVAGAGPARAAISCEPRRRACAVGVPTAKFKLYVARQKKSNWCWAAAIQMVLHLHGVKVRQAELVKRVYGHAGNYRATGWQIIRTLNTEARDTTGQLVRIVGRPNVPNAQAVLDDLKDGYPLLVGLKNPQLGAHAYVLTAAYYRLGAGDKPVITHVVLRDPWPTNPSRRVFPWWYFRRHLMFMTRIRVLRHQARLRPHPGRLYAAPMAVVEPSGLLRPGELDGPPGLAR